MALALAPVAGNADLDNQLFTSPSQRIKLTVPKGWRASDLPSYPGVLLWMLRSQPEGAILVGAEPMSHALYCSWSARCRQLGPPLAGQYACALREQLEAAGMVVGPAQPGPKENRAAGLPSLWFEYSDGTRFVRQALAVSETRAVTLALTATTAADRSTHGRAFDQALRSLRPLSEAETRPAPAAPAVPASGATPAEGEKSTAEEAAGVLNETAPPPKAGDGAADAPAPPTTLAPLPPPLPDVETKLFSPCP